MLEIQDTVLFEGMSESEVREALCLLDSQEKSYTKGEAVLHAGSCTKQIGLVLQGSVTVESNDLWGNRTILGLAGSGELFAESYALLAREPLMVDVIANEPSQILFLTIAKVLNDSIGPKIWQSRMIRNLLRISAQKNLLLSERSFHISQKSVRARIMAYLNSVSLKKGSLEFTIPFDRQQLADYLNLDRTAVSKELGHMQREGILEFKKNHFRLIKTLSGDL